MRGQVLFRTIACRGCIDTFRLRGQGFVASAVLRALYCQRCIASACAQHRCFGEESMTRTSNTCKPNNSKSSTSGPQNRPRNRNPKKPENSSKRPPKWRRESTPNRQKWTPGPLPMASSILNPFWDRPRGGLCAPNIANNVSNSHRALVQKGSLGLPFGLHFGAFGLPFALF